MTGILALAGAIAAAEFQAGEAWQLIPGQQMWTVPGSADPKMRELMELGPGQKRVFRSVPFAGIVVVPPEGVDEAMVRKPNDSVDYSMRVVAPELRLLPQGERR